MHPDSIWLVVLLVLFAGAMLFLLRRSKHLAVGAVAGLVAFALAAMTGMAVVNDYYGYYQSWSQLSADLTGSYTSFNTPVVNRSNVAANDGHGQLRTVQLAGARSGINRSGLVYLPPQYFQKRFAHTRFPVMELIHGTPGQPSDWVVHLRLLEVLKRLEQQRLAGPMIIVMPQMSVGNDFQECVDGPGAKDDTYITQDVRTDVVHAFRASPVSAEWGIAGYSSGGYCAANLALRHRSSWGASGIMDGYFRPQDGPAAAALGNLPALEAANDPLTLAAGLPAGVAPLPAIWMSAGTGDAADYAGAKAFAKALHGIETVPLYKEAGAGHNFYAWAGALPHLLSWAWQQLAPPQLRTLFPVAGSVTNSSIVPPVPLHSRHHHTRSTHPAPHRLSPSTGTSGASLAAPRRTTSPTGATTGATASRTSTTSAPSTTARSTTPAPRTSSTKGATS